ncbi:MAG: universal stress protein [Gammaproteobacteria bacterium]|nr:MAG: universal stress protein [Gammaproteobacteria bacterium]
MSLYQHILVSVDFTPPAEQAARKALALARQFDARLTFLHVIDYFPEDIPNDWIAPEDEDPQAYLQQRAEEALRELNDRLGAAAETVVLFTEHSAAAGIVTYGQDHGVDLTLVACHGHRGISALLSSTVERVSRHAQGDVLVVHPTA